MGLSICYELRLPGNTSEVRVTEIVEQLRDRSRALDLDHTSPIYRLSLAELQIDRTPSWTSLDFFFYVVASVTLGLRDNDASYGDQAVEQTAAIGFAAHPGRDCEAASFGFVRPLLRHAPANSENPTDWNKWIWYACCKTQYASTVSSEHLIRCHLAIIELLEEASRLGVDVTVHDETGYWETRSTEHLVAEVEKMNRVVAAFGGALHDAVSPEKSVAGSIFEHPEFERLETKGRRDHFS